MTNIYYVYMYLRENNTPYYVGKGSGVRFKSRGKNEIKPPKDKSRIRFIERNLSEDTAFMWEEFWIDYFGRIDIGTGCLRNKTNGGEGASGMIQTAESNIKRSIANKNNGLLTKSEFVDKAQTVHGLRYNYSKSVYVKSIEKVEIICKEHGSFWQSPNNHISKAHDCPKCKVLKTIKRCTKTQEQFETEARKIHGSKYTYSKYLGIKQKIEIVCPQHGSFMQTPDVHLNHKCGCPQCGLNKIRKVPR